MRISLSIDERVAAPARQAALAMGKRLAQALHEYIKQLACRAPLETGIAGYLPSTARTSGRLGAWAYDRSELQLGG